MSVEAYARTRNLVETPRQTEARLMDDIITELTEARNAGLTGAALMPALHRNREIWATFASDCGTAGNGLPADLRAAIISLALWVDRHTSDVARGREDINALIDVNRSMMAGLSDNG